LLSGLVFFSGIFFRLNRQGKEKAGSRVFLAFKPNFTAMSLDQPLAYRQAKAGASCCARPVDLSLKIL
jgi:hypothetical protein